MVIFRTIAKISQIYCWGILIWATLYIQSLPRIFPTSISQSIRWSNNRLNAQCCTFLCRSWIIVAWLYNELPVVISNLVHLHLSLLVVVVTVHNEQRSVLSQWVRHLDHYQTTYRQHHAKASRQEGTEINYDTMTKDNQKHAKIICAIQYHHLMESHSNTMQLFNIAQYQCSN